jgi:16S rRNA (cytosine967-C5)-methyltransferase
VAAVTPWRRAAHAVVLRSLTEGAYVDRALHGEARDLHGRERAQAKRLAFGAVQRRLTLDHVIAGRARAGRLDPPVRAALHVGLYELLFSEGAAHAAVAEAVELAKPSPGHRLVNAVLRGVQRDGADLPADDTPQGAAIVHSHPEWLVRLWWDWLGADDARALLRAGNEPAELALRVNPLVEFDLSDVPGRRETPETIVVDGPFDAFAHPGWAAGAFTPQSRASQAVSRTVDPQPGERVLDLCAAPGGKTTHLAARMGDEGEVVAVERHAGRAEALRRTAERLRATCVRVETADARAFRHEAGFDRVLLDPPCSGLGTLRGHPDLRWRMTPESIEGLVVVQSALLEAARANLRPGGTLVYSVCTLSPPEELVAGGWRSWPHHHATDGFYTAIDGRGDQPAQPPGVPLVR